MRRQNAQMFAAVSHKGEISGAVVKEAESTNGLKRSLVGMTLTFASVHVIVTFISFCIIPISFGQCRILVASMILAQCGCSEHAISVSTCAIRMQPYLMFSVSGTLLLQIPTDTRFLLSFSTNVLEAPRILLDLCVDSFTCTLNNLEAVPPTHWTV